MDVKLITTVLLSFFIFFCSRTSRDWQKNSWGHFLILQRHLQVLNTFLANLSAKAKKTRFAGALGEETAAATTERQHKLNLMIQNRTESENMLPSRVFNAARGSKAGKETRIDGKKCGIPKKMWNYYSLTWGDINTGGAVSQVSAVEWSFEKASRLYRSFAYLYKMIQMYTVLSTTKYLTRFCSGHQNEGVVQQNRRPKWATGE